jgi:hypothetical protein
MKVNIYAKSANHPRFEQMLMKFATGVLDSGDDAFFSFDEKYYDCDCAVIFGSWKDRQDTHHRVKNDIVKNAKNFVVVETPLIGRGPVSDVMDDNWYRVGLNGFLADTGNFNNKHKGMDRWHVIRKNLNVELKAYNNPGEYIIVALQLPGDASLRGASIEKWCRNVCIDIRKYTDMPIIIRTPQLTREYNRKWLDEALRVPNVRLEKGTKENMLPMLEKAHCAVTYSSGFGIDAIINGCPVIAMSPSSFVYEICDNTVETINNPSKPNRDQLMFNLSYAQWHISEIENGYPWRHLRELI